MLRKNFLLLPLLLLFSLASAPIVRATHLRGGEILYRTHPNQPLKVSFEVRIYLNTLSPISEEEITLLPGDGSSVRVRHNPTEQEMIFPETYKRVFRVEHVYQAPGTYRVSYTGINRNEGVINMVNSLAHTLYLYTDVVLHPALGSLSSPHLLAPP